MIITYEIKINNYFLWEWIFMVFEKLKAILAEQLDVDENSITRDSLLVEDLGADSLDAIDIVMSVEDEFKLEVPDEIIEKMESVGDILDYIENHA